MRVYHFLNAEYGLKDLHEKRLRVSRISELNDPFEFLGVDLSDPNSRRLLKRKKQSVSNEMGIVCFSKTWTNPVQWAHYADRHRGVCLGFDVPDASLIEVEYIDKRPAWDGSADDTFVRACLRRKFSHWSYEQEVRMLVEAADRQEGENGHLGFSDTLQLRQVLTGARSGVSKRRVQEALGSTITGVEIFRVRAAFRSFAMVRNRARDG